VSLLGSGCADTVGQALQQDVAQLRQDLNAATLALHRSRGDTETLIGQIDRRTREQAAESGRQLGAVSTRMESLGGEVGRLTARLDDLAQRLDELGRRVAALDRRLAEAGRAGTAGPAPGGGGSPAIEPRATGTVSPEQAYQAAYLDFTRGNFPLAVTGFKEFVRRFPRAPQADQAQYWVGESYFSMARASAARGESDKATRELEQAVQEFRRVVLDYPRGSRVPGAIYKEALALIELKQTRLAESRLQYLLDNFPQSEEAALARERLAALRS
jgi:TolA-binding protein